MNLFYLDHLSLYSLLNLIRLRSRYDRLFYFNVKPGIKRKLHLFRRFGLIKTELEPIDFHLSQIRAEDGGSLFMKIIDDNQQLSRQIRETKLAQSWFLKELGKDYGLDKLLLYFEKVISNDLQEPVMMLNVANWHAQQQFAGQKPSVVLLMKKGLWTNSLSSYKDSLRVKIITYKTLSRYNYSKYLPHIKNQLFSGIKALPTKLSRKTKRGPNRSNSIADEKTANKKKSRIAALFSSRTATVDLARRSGFLWFLRSSIPSDRILLYFNRADLPVTATMVKEMREKGLAAWALSPKATASELIPIWATGSVFRDLRRKGMRVLLKKYFKSMFELKKTPLFYLIHMYQFIASYSFWFEFFNSNNIKINIFNHDYDRSHIPMHAALEQNGGIQISYQLSNHDFSSVFSSVSTDVYFAFGPKYKWLWEQNGSSIGNLVYSGYISDHSFRAVADKSVALRDRLLSVGVEVIIAFFDENSSDDRMSSISNETSASIYEFFINMVINDKKIGCIFKPKATDTFYSRMSSISNLIDQAKATRRCIFLDNDRDQLPCEAAKAADLSVGLLIGGTAVLESFLAGTPSVFLDLEKLFSNPIYEAGRGKEVFDNLEDFSLKLKQFIQSPESAKGFGDLSSWASLRDTFRDGDASFRMGQYVGWLLRKFDDGATKEEAINYANTAYGQAWGEENVV